ncbi:MAG: glycosyltransferase, partial [Candidatus Omnitrophica bacterium]|nr:glycosyltransferase [Candidatus Omnitrophota bacterium]
HPFKKRKVQLVHTFHGHIFSGYFNKFTTNFFIFIERILAFFSAKIITVSESVKYELLALDIAKIDKIQVIPLGFELTNFLSIPFAQRTPSHIGIIGRLVPIKNHRLFLEAAAKVIHETPGMKLKFKIIGDAEVRRELEEYSRKLNIANQVIFLGWQKDLLAVYSDLDIIVLTSLNEGTPVSLIEAMASGRAVVATDVGGIRDLLGQAMERGIIVKSGDSIGLANAMKLLLDNSQLRTDLAVKGRDFVKNNFAKERLIKDIENLYSAL